MGSITLGGIPDVSFHTLVSYQRMRLSAGSCWKCSWDCLVLGRINTKGLKSVGKTKQTYIQNIPSGLCFQGFFWFWPLLALPCWANGQEREQLWETAFAAQNTSTPLDCH